MGIAEVKNMDRWATLWIHLKKLFESRHERFRLGNCAWLWILKGVGDFARSSRGDD
jgi:hypothetical protein